MSAHASSPRSLPSTWTARGPASWKLAAVYALAGSCALAAAPALSPFGWPLAWLGVSNWLVAYAYAVNRAAVFGKRADGTLAAASVIALLPYLLLVWGFFWLKLAGLRREPCWHRAADRLYVGRRPRAFELPDDCELVVDLTSEFSAARDVVAARRYRCLPILNRHVPSDAELVALLAELRAFPGAIYVHCGAGRGRSAMVVAALLVLRGAAKNADDAERQLEALRPGIHLHPMQKALIDRCCSALQPGATVQSLARYVESTCAWSEPQAAAARSKR